MLYAQLRIDRREDRSAIELGQMALLPDYGMNADPMKKNNRKLSVPPVRRKYLSALCLASWKEKSGIAGTESAGLGKKSDTNLDNILAAHILTSLSG